MAIGNHKPGREETINVSSLVSHKTGEGIVEITWGSKRGQLSIEEARAHALVILEVAEAAESDSFIFQWLVKDLISETNPIGNTHEQIIAEFKRFRETRRNLK